MKSLFSSGSKNACRSNSAATQKTYIIFLCIILHSSVASSNQNAFSSVNYNYTNCLIYKEKLKKCSLFYIFIFFPAKVLTSNESKKRTFSNKKAKNMQPEVDSKSFST